MQQNRRIRLGMKVMKTRVNIIRWITSYCEFLMSLQTIICMFYLSPFSFLGDIIFYGFGSLQSQVPRMISGPTAFQLGQWPPQIHSCQCIIYIKQFTLPLLLSVVSHVKSWILPVASLVASLHWMRSRHCFL